MSELTKAGRFLMSATAITFYQTGLGLWCPRIEGRDAFFSLSRKHGCSFSAADHPVFEDADAAGKWAAERGYSYSFTMAPMLKANR